MSCSTHYGWWSLSTIDLGAELMRPEGALVTLCSGLWEVLSHAPTISCIVVFVCRPTMDFPRRSRYLHHGSAGWSPTAQTTSIRLIGAVHHVMGFILMPERVPSLICETNCEICYNTVMGVFLCPNVAWWELLVRLFSASVWPLPLFLLHALVDPPTVFSRHTCDSAHHTLHPHRPGGRWEPPDRSDL